MESVVSVAKWKEKEMDYKIINDSLKWPQINAAMLYIYDNEIINNTSQPAILEFGTGAGNSTKKICDYLKANNWEHTWVFTFDSFDGLPYEDQNVKLFPKYTRGAYKLDKTDPIKYIKEKCEYPRLYVVHSDFETLYTQKLPQLWEQDFTEVINPVLIHIDCDLYSSTRAVLSWLYQHKLIRKGLLLAYDEYQSTNSIFDGGESLAHYQFTASKNIITDEIWRNTYYDKDNGQRIRQSVWEVVKV